MSEASAGPVAGRRAIPPYVSEEEKRAIDFEKEARAHIKKKELAQAEVLLRKAVEVWPDSNSQARFLFANVLLQNRKSSEALVQFNKLFSSEGREHYDRDSVALVAYGDAACECKDEKLANEIYRKVIALNIELAESYPSERMPNSVANERASAHLIAGHEYYQRGDAQLAIQEYKVAEDAAPTWDTAKFHLALAYEFAEDFESYGAILTELSSSEDPRIKRWVDERLGKIPHRTIAEIREEYREAHR